MSKISEYSMFEKLDVGWVAPCVLLLSACSGDVASPAWEVPSGTDTSPVATGTAPHPIAGDGLTTPAPTASTDPGGPSNADGTATLGDPTSPATTTPPPLPVDDGAPGRALIRRLSNAEYAATIRSLLQDETDYSASFPADTVVNGFTNNTDVQDVGPALAEQYMVAAEAISAKAVQDSSRLVGCDLSVGDACFMEFIQDFGTRAWRRPLTDVEQNGLLALFRSQADATTGIRLTVQALLVSPSFLYRTEVGVPVPGETYSALTSWEMASRLSYFFTGTMPDAELLAAAQADALVTPAQIEAQARRLLETEAARKQVADFFSGWLNLRALDRLERDSSQFPSWDSRLPGLFHEETREFATRIVFDPAGDLATLLTAPYTYGNSTLAAYYGGTVSTANDGISRIELPPNQRAGLLTHASFLATHAKEIETDPVARGKFVRERLLCQGIPAPPPDLLVTAPEITPGSTTRERFAQHVADPSCAGCHTLIDPIGLAFEHYDPIGQWRDAEHGAAIDASGELTASDVPGAYDGVVEMAAKLAQSAMVSECFVRYWFRFAFGRGEGDEEGTRMVTITKTFQAEEQRIRELLIALTQTPDFLYLAKDIQP